MAELSKSVSAVGGWFSRLNSRLVSVTPRLQPYLKEGWLFALIILSLLISQLTLLANAQVGVYVNAAAFLALVGVALWKESARQLAISCAILPVAAMVCLSMPPTTTRFNLLMVYYDTILVLALVYRFLFTVEYPVSWTRLTMRGYAVFVPVMMLIGELLGGLGYLMLKHHFPFTHHLSVLMVIVIGIQFAITEETLFRGLIQQRGRLVLHPLTAAIMATLLYTIASIGLGSGPMVIFALISGAAYSTIYYFKQNLVLTITANTLTKLTYLALLNLFIFR